MKEFDELVKIMEKLRSEDGCPWDKEQTFESLKPYLLEETYEVLEAMDEGGDKLKGELGDLLLQVIFQAQIAKEDSEFTIEDVIKEICNKMIRRHPHIFGDVKNIKTADDVSRNWDIIKKGEKEHEDRKSILDGIPKNFPALLRAEKLQKKAASTGFDWSDIQDVLSKVEEEIDELRDEIISENNQKIEEELGDLFFALVNVARHAGVNPEICLKKASDKFEKRFKYIESKCDIKKANLKEMDNLWEEAKKLS